MQFPGRLRTYLRARSEKRKKETLGFSFPSVLALADRVKAIATEANDGSLSGVRENVVVTQAHENPEHRGQV